MAARKPLQEYDAKRDFTRSPEPSGKVGERTGRSFCVQKHLASHLHYDFRLEHNGVLLSWAVPKGPSLNPGEKRMAVHVEDHPIDYGEFEGVIPSGYGAGVVLLWDRGMWIPESANADIDAALAGGELKFRLDGVKLKGSWVLVRTKRPMPGSHGEQWLLIKHRDRWSGEVDVTELADSVKSFGGFADILAAHGTPKEWKAHPPAKGGDAGRMFSDVMAQAARRLTDAPPADSRTPKSRFPGRPKTAAARSSTIITSPQPAASPARPKFTNRDKVLFPKTGFTKGDLIDYYTRIAPLMLPQLAGRAVTMRRFPDGVDGKSFFEKHCPDHRPPWVGTISVPSEKADDKTIDYCTIDTPQALQWAANLAAIELHVPLALGAAPDTPTALIFDLDPGPPATLADCCRIALRLKGLLDALGLASLPKTSGGKGLHVLVPLNTPGITFTATKAFARAVALTLQKDDPKHVTAVMAKAQRPDRVFIDWGRNDRDKTNAAVFSVRAGEQPTVSWPMDWEELSKRKPPLSRTAAPTLPLTETRRLLKILERRQSLPTFAG